MCVESTKTKINTFFGKEIFHELLCVVYMEILFYLNCMNIHYYNRIYALYFISINLLKEELVNVISSAMIFLSIVLLKFSSEGGHESILRDLYLLDLIK